MAITTYTGTGGTAALMTKLQELHDFVRVEAVNAEGTYSLYLTEQVSIMYDVPSGWADMIVNGSKFPFIINAANDARPWALVTTAAGFVLSLDGAVRAFISHTVDDTGTESWGMVAHGSNSNNLHGVAADGMAAVDTWAHGSRFDSSTHFTQVYNVTPKNATVYFPDLYVIACSPISTTRQMSLNGTTYYASMYIALADERASGGGADLSNYYTRPQTDAKIAAVQEGVETNAAKITTLQAQSTLNTAPMQDASVEGQYMLYAEYTFPKSMNFESSDITLLVRNRGVLTTAKDGILRVRLRYGKASAAFQYAQIYWLAHIGIDASKFVLCYNNATATARLYVSAVAAYDGYICKVLDMGTSANVVDLSAWNLYSPTTGTAELPLESDGWTTVTSTDPAAAASE